MLLTFLLLAAQALAPAHLVARTNQTAARVEESAPIVPFEELLRRPARLRPGLEGKHPRVFFDAASLKLLRERARTTQREMWRETSRRVRGVEEEPLPAGHAALDRAPAQYDAAYTLAELTFAYVVEQDPRHLAAAKKWLKAVVSWEPWGYTYRTPNVDLPPAHLLYAVGFAYDSLYDQLDAGEREAVRRKLARQARLMYEYFKYKPKKRYAYSQNHSFIPMTGLAVAAFALMGEEPEAEAWARLARAVYDRVLLTFGTDGYYYEGFEYWVFSTPWLVHYLDAHAHATGEDLYDRPGFRQMHKYVAHSTLPSGRYVFDFGDIYEGPLTRAGQGPEYKRANPGGRFHTNYNILYRLAQRFRDPEAQGVAEWMKSLGHYNAENYWSLLWYEPAVRATPVSRQKTWHYFADHGVAFWRSDWTTRATAFAFKAGPPEGHHTTALLRQFPDWHLSSGHAHPDAGSFIIYARGAYLTGDSGYAGVPMTAHHNTVLFDGRGQAREGKGHDAFDDVPYERMDAIRIDEAELGPRSVTLRADLTSAYEPELGLARFVREFRFDGRSEFVITDTIRASKAVVPTWLLHADERVSRAGDGTFFIDAAGARLLVEVAEPSGARAVVEPNELTAPGSPGSVDKGERQVRGERLAISTPAPSADAKFVVRLRVKAPADKR